MKVDHLLHSRFSQSQGKWVPPKTFDNLKGLRNAGARPQGHKLHVETLLVSLIQIKVHIPDIICFTKPCILVEAI